VLPNSSPKHAVFFEVFDQEHVGAALTQFRSDGLQESAVSFLRFNAEEPVASEPPTAKCPSRPDSREGIESNDLRDEHGQCRPATLVAKADQSSWRGLAFLGRRPSVCGQFP
jgi:hypothetical protein